MLDLSIIVVTYNKSELLQQCLESLYDNIAQTVRNEIIVVDNNSQDNTLQMLQERFPYVKIIANSRNVGFARGNNQGMRIAQGKYLLLLNNDTFVLSDAVEKMIKFLNENLTAGAVGPALVQADGITIQAQGASYNKKFWSANRPVATRFLSGAVFMIRREALEDVGEMDDNFFFYNEDLDWCRRIVARGWQIYYLPQAKVIHYGGQSTTLINERAIVEGFRGGLYFCYKYYRLFFIPYRAVLFLFCLLQVSWQMLMLVLWKKKRQSFYKLKAYLEIAGITVLWSYSQKRTKERLAGDTK